MLMFPFIAILVPILVAAIMTIVKGQSFKINIMHLFHIQFGNQNETGPTVEKLLNAINQRSSRRNSQVSYSKIIRKPKDRKDNDKQGKWHKYSKNLTKGKYVKTITYESRDVNKNDTDIGETNLLN